MDVSRACNRQGGAGDPRAPRTARRLPRERLPRAEPWSGGSPDPIPNSAVKPHLAESTAAPGRGRTGRSARRGRFSALRPPWRDGRTCRCRGSDGRPALPLVRGSARRGGRSAPRRGNSGRQPDPRRLPRASLCDKTILLFGRPCGRLFVQAREPARRAKRGGQKTTRYAGARRRLRPCVKTPPVGIRYGCSSRISPERRPFWQTRHTACRTRSGCASTTSCSHRSIGAN